MKESIAGYDTRILYPLEFIESMLRKMNRFLLSVAAVALFLVIEITPQSIAQTTESGTNCTIVGTPGDDVLRGTKKADVICGLGGNDEIFGGKGSDTIDGGPGKDSIDGESGNDVILGGSEDDFLNGGPGSDTLLGDEGDDGLIGGYGDDSLYGGDEYGNAYDEDNVCEPENSPRDVVQNCGYDSHGPQVTALSISPGSVNTSTASKKITARFTLEDDLVGILQVDFWLSRGSTNGTGNDYECHQVNGDFRGGEWVCTAILPKFSTNGRWYAHIRAVDNAFNDSQLAAVDPELFPGISGSNFHINNELVTRDFPTGIVQNGPGDITSPELRSFRTSATRIDTSGSGIYISATFRVTDDLAGTDWASCALRNAEGLWYPRLNDPKSDGKAELISGNRRDGIWGCRVLIPRLAPPSEYKWQIRIFDNVNHEKYLQSNGANGFESIYGGTIADGEATGFGTSTIVSQIGTGDTIRPRLLEITPSRTYVNTIKKAQRVSFDFRLTDDLSGIREVQCGMSGAVLLKIGRVSGNSLDGIYRCLIQLPKGAPQGYYQFEVNAAHDAAGWGLINYTLPGGQIRNGCEIGSCPE